MEGEFERRIDKAQRVYDTKGNYLGVKELYKSEVLGILKEMWSEFPVKSDFDLGLDEITNYSLFDWRGYTDAILKWKKKWSGKE